MAFSTKLRVVWLLVLPILVLAFLSEAQQTQAPTNGTVTSTTTSSLTQSTYGLPYSKVEQLFADVATTTWGNWDPDSSVIPSDAPDPFGQAAWSTMWNQARLPNFTRGMYTTTVPPTSVPTSELVRPPPRYFNPVNGYKFPHDFVLGVAGSAAQVEGAIADEGRGVALPDYLLSLVSQSPFYQTIIGDDEVVPDYATSEHYYLYKQDIIRLAAIGVKHYSFSIPWTRILPFTFPGTPVNSQGLDHYDEVINIAISNGIQPIVTLLHNDMPAAFFGNDSDTFLQSASERAYFGYTNGGYQYPEFEDAFVHYGRIVMAHFADRVPIWVTINEPGTGATNGAAIDHVLKAHARLWHFYHEELQGTGKVTMKMGGWPGVPQDPHNETHLNAVQHYNDLNIGTLLDPLALGKDYPEAYKMTIQDYVPLTPADLLYLGGTLDFIAADLYSTFFIYPAVPNIPGCAADNSTNNKAYPFCVGITFLNAEGWNMGYHTDYFSYMAPTYLRDQLNYLWTTYKLPLMVSEFGLSINTDSYPPSASSLKDIQHDMPRSDYYIGYLNEILLSIWEDGVDVVGALMWSFVDCWEVGTWKHAWGVQYNNRTTQERSYKRSLIDVVGFVEGRRVG